MRMWPRVLAAMLIGCFVLVTTVPTAGAATFVDLAGHWSETEVARAVQAGFVNGYPDGTFRPENDVSRAEIVKMLAAALDLTPVAGKDPVFNDSGGHWVHHQGWLSAAIEAGVVRVEDAVAGRFRPDDPATRLDIAVWAARALDPDAQGEAPSGPLPFTDAGAVPASLRGYVQLAVAHDILRGYPDGAFRPQQPATRAEAVVIIFRTLAARGDVDEGLPPDDGTVWDGTLDQGRHLEPGDRLLLHLSMERTLTTPMFGVEGDLTVTVREVTPKGAVLVATFGQLEVAGPDGDVRSVQPNPSVAEVASDGTFTVREAGLQVKDVGFDDETLWALVLAPALSTWPTAVDQETVVERGILPMGSEDPQAVRLSVLYEGYNPDVDSTATLLVETLEPAAVRVLDSKGKLVDGQAEAWGSLTVDAARKWSVRGTLHVNGTAGDELFSEEWYWYSR